MNFSKVIKMNCTTLKNVLWNNGWKKYWNVANGIQNKLSKYRSVSELPDNVSETDLKDLSDALEALAIQMEKISSKIK